MDLFVYPPIRHDIIGRRKRRLAYYAGGVCKAATTSHSPRFSSVPSTALCAARRQWHGHQHFHLQIRYSRHANLFPLFLPPRHLSSLLLLRHARGADSYWWNWGRRTFILVWRLWRRCQRRMMVGGEGVRWGEGRRPRRCWRGRFSRWLGGQFRIGW